MLVRINTGVRVNAAKSKLMLLKGFNAAYEN